VSEVILAICQLLLSRVHYLVHCMIRDLTPPTKFAQFSNELHTSSWV